DRAAAVAALSAGLDIELPETTAYPHLAGAVEDGELALDVVDTAVRRILRQKVELGLLDPEFDAAATGAAIDLDAPESRALARRMAEESIILLDNPADLLPLRAGAADGDGPGSIALIGPAAVQPRSFLGCYSFTNHVLSRLEDNGTSVDVPPLADALSAELPAAQITTVAGTDLLDPARSGTARARAAAPTLAAALRAQFPAAQITTVAGTDFLDPAPSGIAEAVAAAQDAELAVLAVGDLAGLFGAGTSGEGCDVESLQLPGAQHDLVEAVLATGTPVVLLLVTGRPYSLGAYRGRARAIVQAFMPGEEGASALAGVLSGRINPSGRLPIGIPDGVGGQPGTYLAPVLGWVSEGISNLDPKPLFPFGHGLSYSRFEYSELALSAEKIAADGTVEISATVSNTGDRDGMEVVQL